MNINWRSTGHKTLKVYTQHSSSKHQECQRHVWLTANFLQLYFALGAIDVTSTINTETGTKFNWPHNHPTSISTTPGHSG